jgi:MFS family permease
MDRRPYCHCGGGDPLGKGSDIGGSGASGRLSQRFSFDAFSASERQGDRCRNGPANGHASAQASEASMSAGEGEDRPTPWAALLGVTGALALFGAAQGLSYPLFTLLMQRQGLPPGTIGLSAAMMPIGLLLSAPLVPRAIRLVGPRGLAIGCALAGALCFLLIGWRQDAFAWFVLRLLVGFIINPLYILGEVWALAMAPPARRGRVMGVFNTVLSAGFATGPLTLALVGSEGWPPFVVIVLAFCLCAAVLAAAPPSRLSAIDPSDDPAPEIGLLGFARIAPALLFAVIIASANQQGLYALMPVFGAAFGRAEAVLAAMLTVLSFGNMGLQIPLGLMAERFGGRAMTLACAVITAVCAALLPVVISTPAVWPLLFVMGGVCYGVYTMALVELGTRFHGRALIAGNAAFALMWGAGGIVGPPLSGAAIQLLGAQGLPVTIIFLVAVLLVFSTYRKLARRSGPSPLPPMQERE